MSGDADAGNNAGQPEQHELISRLKADVPEGFVYLVGLIDKSNGDDNWRLYLTARGDCYAEFKAKDVAYERPVDGGVVPGFISTCIVFRQGANVRFTESVTADDQLDLDVRMILGEGGRKVFPARTMTPSASCLKTCR